MKREKRIRLLEFFVIGVVMGLIEDLLAIAIATDATIDAQVMLTVLLVAIPFAFFSELVVDNPQFWRKLLPASWYADSQDTP